MYGYNGKIAKINLSKGTIEDYPVVERDFEMFLGGKSLAAYEPRAAQGMGLGYATSNRGGWDKNGVPTEKRLRKLGLEGYHI